MSNEEKDKREALLKIVRDAALQDQTLRETYKIGDKFRFIRDRLNALLSRLEEEIFAFKKESEKEQKKELSEDEVLVYVYLYNAQGAQLKTWQKMLHADVFYEYSVNRPIYAEKSMVESVIKGKKEPIQHGYLTIAVKKEFIMKTALSSEKKSSVAPVIKVREGSLQKDRLISFTHNGGDYFLDEEGVLQKKNL